MIALKACYQQQNLLLVMRRVDSNNSQRHIRAPGSQLGAHVTVCLNIFGVCQIVSVCVPTYTFRCGTFCGHLGVSDGVTLEVVDNNTMPETHLYPELQSVKGCL